MLHPSVPTALIDVELVGAPEEGAAHVVICSVGQKGTLALDEGGTAEDTAALAAGGFTAATGSTTVLGRAGAHPDHAWFLGLGDGSEQAWRAAGAALVRAANQRSAAIAGSEGTDLQIWLPAIVDPQQVCALVTGLIVGAHWLRISAAAPAPRLGAVLLITTATYELRDAVRTGRALGRATALARDLAGMPADLKSPQWLAETACGAWSTVDGVHAVVRDEEWLAANGFGGVIAVGAGSERPPRLLELSWAPAEVATHLVLVGLGTTFDTGGLAIKPAENMHLMRTAMSGGAAVIAALRAVAELQLPIKVTGLVPCAENQVSGSAYRPGDVITHYGGTTTEVSNTDSAGRVLLADVLSYAAATLSPDLVVDIATLTRAMKVALGLRTGGLFASTDELAERISAAGDRVGERWWRMPLLAEHAEAVRSEIADLRQSPPGPAGITAALFLREFTAGLPWAHLDIAGPAIAEQLYDEVHPVASGFAARTLVELCRGLALSAPASAEAAAAPAQASPR